ncbi:MAG: aminopeptidase [Chloroflexota bacterium]
MIDQRLEKLADILVNYSLKIQPGDWVAVNGDIVAEPLMVEVMHAITKAGGHATMIMGSDALTESFMREASEEQLGWVSPVADLVYNKVDALMTIWGTSNTRSLTNIDPKKDQIRAVAHSELTKIYMNRIANKEMRWVGTQFPCAAFAQEADMSLSDYEDFVFGTTFADKDDPIVEWNRIHDEQQVIVNWLKGKKTVTVKSPNADITLSIAGRDFINADGTQNMPSGEVYTSPVEDSANGWVNFTYPAIRAGREVEGVRLEFKDGKVVAASAEKNEAYLLSQLDSDEGARYLGEFAIGTNFGITKFTKSILYDEKIGGSFHMAVGAGFPEVGGTNTSSIHWDFICDIQKDSEIQVDGELLYKDGQFKI